MLLGTNVVSYLAIHQCLVKKGVLNDIVPNQFPRVPIEILSSFLSLYPFMHSWLTNGRLADALQLKLNLLAKRIK
jgi:hypothetical protein